MIPPDAPGLGAAAWAPLLWPSYFRGAMAVSARSARVPPNSRRLRVLPCGGEREGLCLKGVGAVGLSCGTPGKGSLEGACRERLQSGALG